MYVMEWMMNNNCGWERERIWSVSVQGKESGIQWNNGENVCGSGTEKMEPIECVSNLIRVRDE